MEMAPAYPVVLSVDPPAPQSRLTVFFRLFMVIPHIIVLYFLAIAQAVVTIIAWFAILIVGRYPAGMLHFSAGVLQWSTRVSGYLYLLTGKYPPFALGDDAMYPVRLDIVEAPDARNRLTTFFRIILVIPHVIVLYFLALALFVVGLIAWFAALFTASVPEGLHNFMAGVIRWQVRVNAYQLLLVDPYPPFALN